MATIVMQIMDGEVKIETGYLITEDIALMKQNGSNDDTWWVEPVDPLTFYSIDSSAWAYRYGIAEVPLSYFSISDRPF